MKVSALGWLPRASEVVTSLIIVALWSTPSAEARRIDAITAHAVPLTSSRALHPLSMPATELYEADATSIVAYPLNEDGLPATTPNWQLRGGLMGAFSFGFDGAGYLYVSDADLSQVRVYAPGASDDDLPVRIIPLPGSGCYLSVSQGGYVFVAYNLQDGWSCFSPYLVYAPGAGGDGVSPVQPLHEIRPSGYLWNSVFDLNGQLFMYGSETVYQYNDPIHEWEKPNAVFTKEPREYGLYPPITFEQGTETLYIGTNVYNFHYVYDFAARSLTGMAPDRVTLTKPCNDQGNGGVGDGTAVNRHYIMSTCLITGRMYVFRNHRGIERPVEVLPGGYSLLLWP
jgi:hypothetical protein